MQFAGNVNGVDYYDDSISTIPEAAIAAIRSIENAGTILLGGMDRNIDYDILIDFIREHGQYSYILMYKSGDRIYRELGDLPYCYYREDLQGAVELAKEITPAGKACILSPAAASYGYFKNFEERGDVFQKLIQE
jgi:UDP-N-acetylmuramoylalanine--D-glutamate ligase